MQCNRMQQLVLLRSLLHDVACQISMLTGNSAWNADIILAHTQLACVGETPGHVMHYANLSVDFRVFSIMC